MELEKSLWNLSLAMQSLEDKSAEEILMCYYRARSLYRKAADENVSDTVIQWARMLLDNIIQEVKKRKLEVGSSLFVQIEADGTFVHGYEELKAFLASFEFNTMIQIGDELVKYCASEEQRRALIELQRAIVMDGNG
ncbi:MAG: hypothetical protein IJ864_03900 [Alphaproteobacteria bacterium]|nr:hypothetical protein [Alphaproteobacteria bacterium]